MASTTEDKPSLGERLQKSMQGLPDTVQGSQAWNYNLRFLSSSNRTNYPFS